MFGGELILYSQYKNIVYTMKSEKIFDLNREWRESADNYKFQLLKEIWDFEKTVCSDYTRENINCKMNIV